MVKQKSTESGVLVFVFRHQHKILSTFITTVCSRLYPVSCSFFTSYLLNLFGVK